jgi:hypothetical protein
MTLPARRPPVKPISSNFVVLLSKAMLATGKTNDRIGSLDQIAATPS